METFLYFKSMVNQKAIVEDNKVEASNVSLADLANSVKTILKIYNDRRNLLPVALHDIHVLFLTRKYAKRWRSSSKK